MNEQRRIDVEHLITDEENPRFEAVSTEEDALFSILEDQTTASGNKVLNLARDIATNGLNASELPIVSPIKGTSDFRVREGNRRITAIKLSLDSSKVPAEFNKLAPQFEKLSDAMQAYRIVNCYVCDDEDEIHRLLELRHGGEHDGIGTVKWNSMQTARFLHVGNSQSVRPLVFIQHLKEDYGQNELWALAGSVSITNLGRLISTKEIRQLLGIEASGNDARYCGGHDELLIDVLTTVKQYGVGPIYSKQDRIHLVKKAAQRIEFGWQIQQPLPFEKDALTTDAPNASDTQLPSYNKVDEIPDSISDSANQVRRKPVSNSAGKRMFGQTLRPRGTKSNDIYRAIDWIDEQYLKHPDNLKHLLPILGFSLRLLVETVAREYFTSIGEEYKDSSLKPFLKNVAKPMIKTKIDSVGINDFTLASEWINGIHNLDATLDKWAHGTLSTDRESLTRESELVALIIKEIWS